MGSLFGGSKPRENRLDIPGDGGDASQKEKERSRKRAFESRGLRSALLASGERSSSGDKKSTLG